MAKEIETVEGTCSLCKKENKDAQDTAYFAGLILAKKNKPSKLWPVCNSHVEAAIDIFGNQAFGTKFWPVICDLEKNVLYNSFHADQDGMSMRGGWQEYLTANKEEKV